MGLQRGDRTGPGRIDALGQRQRRRGSDLRQRQAGDVRVIAGQIFGAQRGVFLLVAVQGIDGAGIKSRQPAARKVIVHLGLHGLDGGGGGLGVQSQRQHRRVTFSFFPPVRVGGGGGEKLIHPGLAHTGLAAGIRVGADTVDDVGNDRLGGVVARGISGHDAVAVERLRRKGLGGGGGFVKGDFARVGLAQNLPGKIGDQFAFRRGVIDGGWPQGGAAFEQIVRDSSAGRRPTWPRR